MRTSRRRSRLSRLLLRKMFMPFDCCASTAGGTYSSPCSSCVSGGRRTPCRGCGCWERRGRGSPGHARCCCCCCCCCCSLDQRCCFCFRCFPVRPLFLNLHQLPRGCVATPAAALHWHTQVASEFFRIHGEALSVKFTLYNILHSVGDLQTRSTVGYRIRLTSRSSCRRLWTTLSTASTPSGTVGTRGSATSMFFS